MVIRTLPINTKANPEKIIATIKRNPCATLQQIGDKYDISRERVRQIIKKHELLHYDQSVDKEHKACLQCGKLIRPQNHKFCNKQCEYEYNHPFVECDQCHNLFRAKKGTFYGLSHKQSNGKLKEHTFCSQTCKGVYVGTNFGFVAYPENCHIPKGVSKHKTILPQIREIMSQNHSQYYAMCKLNIPRGNHGMIKRLLAETN